MRHFHHMNHVAKRLLPTAMLLIMATTSCSHRAVDSPVPAMPAVADLPVRTAMPDPLVMNDGHKITTVKQWKKRRKEMKRIIEYYGLGHSPPPPGNVTGHVVLSKTVLGGKATGRLVHLTFGPGKKLSLDVNIFIPTETDTIKPPFPTIVQPSFIGTHNPNQPLASWEKAARGYEEPLRRGYAIGTYT